MDQVRKNIALLAICQALMMTCNSLVIATSALVGLALASDKWMATLPLGLQFLSTMSFTLPASLFMKRLGRRVGFQLGALLGLGGAVLCTYAIFTRSFVGFCGGALLIGAFNAFAQYYRFAAADTATSQFRSKAISLVLAGGVIAAFTGPNLANWTRAVFDTALFSGSYACLIALYAASALVSSFIEIPPPTEAERREAGRPLSDIVRGPEFVVAVLSAMIAYGVMNLLMTSTPLAMQHNGHSFGSTAFVIQWHVLGMFAPSFVTGHLIRRLGLLNVMLAGSVLLGVCAGVNLLGVSVVHFWLALLLLGMGWNFLFTGATTLLTQIYTAAEKAKVQGVNDLLVFATVTLSAMSSGALHHSIGWAAVNLAVTPVIVLSLLANGWLRWQRMQSVRGFVRDK
jgi:MFS family permease